MVEDEVVKRITKMSPVDGDVIVVHTNTKTPDEVRGLREPLAEARRAIGKDIVILVMAQHVDLHLEKPSVSFIAEVHHRDNGDHKDEIFVADRLSQVLQVSQFTLDWPGSKTAKFSCFVSPHQLAMLLSDEALMARITTWEAY